VEDDGGGGGWRLRTAEVEDEEVEARRALPRRYCDALETGSDCRGSFRQEAPVTAPPWCVPFSPPPPR